MSDTDVHEDGGPAFPSERGNVPEADDRGHARGMSKRELFAAILMHSEAVTCGLPGEACEALIQASDAAGDDVIDHMAMNAVQGADALLRALNGPLPPKPITYDAYAASAEEKDALKTLRTRTWFEALPSTVREFVQVAVREIDRANSDEDDIPF